MKLSILKSIYFITLISLIGPMAAFADASYVCPTVDQLKNNVVNDIGEGQYNEWIAGSPPFTIPGSDPINGVVITMYDGKTLDFAQKLQQTTTTVVPFKMYPNDPFKHQGTYIWVCNYDLDPRSVFAGDIMFVWSKQFDAHGRIVKSNYSKADQLALIHQIESKLKSNK